MKRNRRTTGDIIFDCVINLFMFAVLIVTLYPFVNQIAISFSDNTAVMSGTVSIWPKNFNLDAYRTLVADRRFFGALKNTAFFTVMYTVISMAVTAVFAYPLSKRYLKGRGVIMGLLVFSMMFGTGGLIPNYMVVKNLGLVNSYFAIILPAAISIWNVIILKNFYQQIPGDIEEAAKIDGASNTLIFLKIILPLSVPSLAALTLFVSVEAWNTFFNAMIYINNPDKKLLQVYLNDILRSNVIKDGASIGRVSSETSLLNPETLKAAALMCATVPILIVYPFVQKYFMSGLMMGSIKG